MNEIKIGEIIKERRAAKGVSQEALAAVCGVSMQAVSKWENGQSCPDITFLPLLAEYFQVSVDYLLTGKEIETKSETTQTLETEPASANAQADRIQETDNADTNDHLKGMTEKDTLYIIQYRNGHILDQRIWEQNGPHKDEVIPIIFEKDFLTLKNNLHIEVWGNANIEAKNISMNLYAGGNVKCGAIEGSVAAEGNISCGNVEGGASAEGSIACGNIEGSAFAGGSIACGGIEGDVSAGGDIACGNVEGNLSAGRDINCGDIEGDAQAGNTITCHDISGSAKAETIQYIND